MKRLLLGAGCLILILSACLCNYHYLSCELKSLQNDILQSISQPEDKAHSLIVKAYEQYKEKSEYTGFVLRESKCEAIEQGFIDCISSPGNKDLKYRLAAELEEIIKGEMLKLSSIF